MAFSTEPAHATHVSSITAKHRHILPHFRRPLRSLQVAHASPSFSCFAGDHSRPRVPQHGWVPRPPPPKTTAALVPRSARGGGRAPEDGGGRGRRRPGRGERGGPRRPWMPWTRAGPGRKRIHAAGHCGEGEIRSAGVPARGRHEDARQGRVWQNAKINPTKIR